MHKIQKCLSGQGQAIHLPKQIIVYHILNPWIGISFQRVSEGKQEGFRVSIPVSAMAWGLK